MSVSVSEYTTLWMKLILSVVFMLAALAMVVWWVFGVTFEDFKMQVGLYIIAFAIGMIGVGIALRTKMELIR